eukprot:gene9153-9321_t
MGAALEKNRELQSRLRQLLQGIDKAAPLPVAGQALVSKSGPLLKRLWSWRLGRWSPAEQQRLRDGVRLAAIKLVYEEELQALEQLPGGVTVTALQSFQARMNSLKSASLASEPLLRLAVERFRACHWAEVAADWTDSRSAGEVERHWRCYLSAKALEPLGPEELLRLG